MKRPLRTYLFIGLSMILLLVLCYNAFKLFDLNQKNSELSAKIASANTVNSGIAKLRKDLARNPISIEQSLFPVKSEVFNLVGAVQARFPVVVKGVKQVESRNSGGYEIVSYVSTVEGDYDDLLRSVNYIETNIGHAKVSSIVFESQKVKGASNEWKLNMKIYVQGVIKI